MRRICFEPGVVMVVLFETGEYSDYAVQAFWTDDLAALKAFLRQPCSESYHAGCEDRFVKEALAANLMRECTPAEALFCRIGYQGYFNKNPCPDISWDDEEE
jgi:hypothetical protein